jgi:hypothetical protein
VFAVWGYREFSKEDSIIQLNIFLKKNTDPLLGAGRKVRYVGAII